MRNSQPVHLCEQWTSLTAKSPRRADLLAKYTSNCLLPLSCSSYCVTLKTNLEMTCDYMFRVTVFDVLSLFSLHNLSSERQTSPAFLQEHNRLASEKMCR